MPSLLDQSFIQGVVFLLLTAALTSFAIPYLFRKVDQQKDEQSRIRDAQLARQKEILSAQEKVLDELTRLLWSWRYSVMRLTYHGCRLDLREDAAERFNAAEEEYGDQFWALLSQIRIQISLVKRFASVNTHKSFIELYKHLVEVDRRLNNMKDLPIPQRRLEYLDLNSAVYVSETLAIENMLDLLAGEFGLNLRDSRIEEVQHARRSRYRHPLS